MDRADYIRTACAAKYVEAGRHPFGDLKPYHVSFCAEMERRFGFEGKHVLEVGGSLNKNFVLDDLHVASWTAVHEVEYWKSIGCAAEDLMDIDFHSFEEMTVDRMTEYQIVTSPIERLPRHLFRRFDLVISMAAFTFLHQIGPALEKIYWALKPGGGFGIMCGQIWSSDEGNFFHTVEDHAGRKFSGYKIDGHQNPIPPWGHLLMTAPQMFAYLSRFTDSDSAGQIVHQTYVSPRMNRVFADDYNLYFGFSSFGRKGKVESHLVQRDLPDPQLQRRLEELHPGRRNFNSRSLVAFLERTTKD